MSRADDLRNRMALADRKVVSRATMQALSAIQFYPPHVQVLALGVLFMAMARHHGVRTHDALLITDNVAGNPPAPEFRAVNGYMKGYIR